MRTKLKTLFSLVIANILLVPILIVSIIPSPVLANGMVLKPGLYLDQWDYLDLNNQLVFINYENGLQKMILSIGMEEVKEGAVWIFPVPADPSKVAIDVVTEFPWLEGKEISEKARANLSDIAKALQTTQIYPIPIITWLEGNRGVVEMGILEVGDITIHERLEKEGIITEIITARTAQALHTYLQNKNLKVEEGAIPALNHYIGKEFTFVVSWISEINVVSPEFQPEQRGVFVTFPTQKIYFPLLLTSVYGSEVIPISIRIFGHRSPKIFNEIKPYTEVEYFIDSYVRLSEGLEKFYDGSTENVRYTKIEITAPSKFFVDDLWISPGVPLRTYYSSFIVLHPFFSAILLLILISVITSIIVGWIVFRDLRNKNGIFKLMLVGLSNCLSIIGLIMATFLLRTKAVKEEDKSLLIQLKSAGYSSWLFRPKDKMKFVFVPFFSISFLVISWLTILLIKFTV